MQTKMTLPAALVTIGELVGSGRDELSVSKGSPAMTETVLPHGSIDTDKITEPSLMFAYGRQTALRCGH